ncbi:MAG: amidohydrolase family protein [Oleiphilaceae bacterium]|nr:amidohydrolase family protein [Oleiphilaceae bacterium]
MAQFDIAINHGILFDGSKSHSKIKHVGIKDGVVAQLSDQPITSADSVIDASGKWVTPGFIDTHTHYDAELIASPGLKESVRHGVTTVTIGNCSISMTSLDAEDCSDLFTRVESVPREHVLPLLKEKKTWTNVSEYVEFLEQHPLGPNISSFIGHSEIRAAVLGLGRAVDRNADISEHEYQKMESMLDDALKHGLLGMSAMTTSWDKLDGDRYRSASLPSTYAKWKEFRRLNAVLRKYDAIHQGAPNIVTKVNMFLFFWESMGLFFRKPLKTTLISLMDLKANPMLVSVVAPITRLINKLGRADFRWQSLPNPFEVYADGIDLVIFEEFGAGEAALHLRDEVERNTLMKDEGYRRRFRKEYDKKWGPRVWQRDFNDATIVECPDQSLKGMSFGQVAKQRSLHPVDVFLDLVVEYGTQLRWHTVIANYRHSKLEKLVSEKSLLISFADSGAHIRNMAYYNFPLRLLKLVRDAGKEGRYIMTMEEAVWRVTGELADWFNIDAGYIREGSRADIVVLDPEGLDQELDLYHEAPIEEFGNIDRMVNRNPGLVDAVLINGNIAFENEEIVESLGKERAFGQFLRAASGTQV